MAKLLDVEVVVTDEPVVVTDEPVADELAVNDVGLRMFPCMRLEPEIRLRLEVDEGEILLVEDDSWLEVID